MVRLNQDEARERLEDLEDVLMELRLANDAAAVIVEGDRDEIALRNLGLGGEILKLNRGMQVFTFAESLNGSHSEVVLLTDWDRMGGHLAKLLREALEANGIRVNDAFRKDLIRATNGQVRHVEGLDTHVRNLRDRLGVYR